ncbi:hypothetical protein GCM10023340_19050 [Nocardioides marinquilinus]|uniref:Uncharacterized protein n=1 Tax=Nocardioides marinquilinus TaxID=1210400 RepID=A0ABP9PND6_9ACTN
MLKQLLSRFAGGSRRRGRTTGTTGTTSSSTRSTDEAIGRGVRTLFKRAKR